MPKKTTTRKKRSDNPSRKPTRTKQAFDPGLSEYRRKRDFSHTDEPEGGGARRGHKPQFVVQKHAASHLHYDLRLEHDGVMKSWAVPKGPSLDPAVKRLAMQVEDHPIEYNEFEGTIPQGEYGGGTVMLWDRGTYSYGGTNPDPEEGLRRGYEKGDFKFVLNGTWLKGSWALVRMRGDRPGKPQWLLIKHTDEFAAPGSDVVAEQQTSVSTGRTMDEISEGKSRSWHSNRPETADANDQAESGAKPRGRKPAGSAYERLMARYNR
ncbi:MAG: DNA polymerase ligase N-terminal domain-containing protein [Gemmatimonadales bacterium]